MKNCFGVWYCSIEVLPIVPVVQNTSEIHIESFIEPIVYSLINEMCDYFIFMDNNASLQSAVRVILKLDTSNVDLLSLSITNHNIDEFS